jgi:hypothetical protein
MNKVAMDRANVLSLLNAQLVDVKPGTAFTAFLKRELKSPITNGVFLETKNFYFHITIDGLMGDDGFEPGCAIEYNIAGKPASPTRMLLNTSGILKFDLKKALKPVMADNLSEGKERMYEENIEAAKELMDAIFLLAMKFAWEETASSAATMTSAAAA